MSANVTVMYSVEKGTLEGESPMMSKTHAIKGYFAWFSALRPPNCTVSEVPPRGDGSPFIVGTAGEFQSTLKFDSLLTDLTTGRPTVGVNLAFMPGTVIHRFRATCQGGHVQDGDGAEEHAGWSLVTRRVLKLDDERIEPWQAKDMVFVSGVAEYAWNHAYSGGSFFAVPGDDDLVRQEVRGTSRLTLRHTPYPDGLTDEGAFTASGSAPSLVGIIPGGAEAQRLSSVLV